MLFYFEDLKKKYNLFNKIITAISVLTLLVGLAVAFIVKSGSSTVPLLIFTIMILEFVIALAFMSHLNLVASKRQFESQTLLLNDGKPNDFIAYQKEMYNTNDSKNHKYDAIIILNLSAGYKSAGNIEEEIALINTEFDGIPNKDINSLKLALTSNLVNLYIDCDDVESAKRTYNQLVEELKTLDDKDNYKSMVVRNIKESEMRLQLGGSSVEDGIEYFKDKVNNAKNNYDKCNSNYALGCLYLQKQDVEQSKKCFNEVIELGNDLYIVSMSKKINNQ